MNNITISQDLTVNQIIEINPQTVSVFARCKIDSCCGCELPLEQGPNGTLDLAAVLAELNDIEPAYSACNRY
jgi:iron-sulfur cluster repair protein YtfE (RIC family)